MVKADKKDNSDQGAIFPISQFPCISSILVNGLILMVLLVAWIAIEINPKLYYLSIQEDQIIEWMTFWTFFAAGGIYLQTTYKQFRLGSKVPWFLLSVSLFCFFVAMEEISWCQRFFAYRPPTYFLEQNFQQEFNVHNVFDKDLRQLFLKVVIIGFGVVFPAVGMVPVIRRFFVKMIIVPPPILFSPAFLVTYCFFEVYPWVFAGELVELMLGLGFLFSAMTILFFFKNSTTSRLFFSVWIVSLISLVVLLSVIMINVSNFQLSNQPEVVGVAKKEIVALGHDLRRAMSLEIESTIQCMTDRRVFYYVEKYGVDSLYKGLFWNLTKKGLPEERALFFIDPWNMAYWVWQLCDPEKKKVKIFLYSFGPNCRRDSVAWKIKGDDIGMVIYESGFKKKLKQEK